MPLVNSPQPPGDTSPRRWWTMALRGIHPSTAGERLHGFHGFTGKSSLSAGSGVSHVQTKMMKDLHISSPVLGIGWQAWKHPLSRRRQALGKYFSCWAGQRKLLSIWNKSLYGTWIAEKQAKTDNGKMSRGRGRGSHWLWDAGCLPFQYWGASSPARLRGQDELRDLLWSPCYSHASINVGIHSKKCVRRWFHLCVNVMELPYTNLESIDYDAPRLFSNFIDLGTHECGPKLYMNHIKASISTRSHLSEASRHKGCMSLYE